MKSTILDLESRGYIDNIDLRPYERLTKDILLEQLNSTCAIDRSIAANLLSTYLDCKVAIALLQRLNSEKALYTKIEICKTLESGDVNTAKEMMKYLGKIGNNQYCTLPTSSSKKKSYPLPRDIIARSLARMSLSIFPLLLARLDIDDPRYISELVDAIGFMVFYNQELATNDVLHVILNTMDKNKMNAVVYWKCITCLSAFPTSESLYVLAKIDKESSGLIKQEAKRGIDIIMNVHKLNGNEKALQYLNRNKLLHMGLIIPIMRNSADIIYASDDGVMIFDRNSYTYMISVDDITLGKSLIDNYGTKQLYMTCQKEIFDYLKQKYTFDDELISYQAVYLDKQKVILNNTLNIKVLDMSHFDIVRRHYKTIDDPEYIEERIINNELFGGFKDDQLVGFIGIHAEGSMGLLEIFPEFRRLGYAYELEGYLINHFIELGICPYSQVNLANEKSLNLQKKIGCSISEELVYWLY